MPDGKTHKLIGTGTGAIYAAYRAKEQNTLDFWIEIAGGAVGGYVGGLLPDIIEPATSPSHRAMAHSYAAGGGVVAMKNVLAALEATFRENALNCRAIPTARQDNAFVPVPIDPISQFLLKVAELFWRLLAGFVNGLAAGYVSHLALDAATPRSLPLLGAGR